jgi:hypothetical protein
MKKYLFHSKVPFFIAFLLIICQSKAQVNLVANGGFETNSSCPNFGAQWSLCTGWNNVNMNIGIGSWGTPDYFHSCGSGNVLPPNTFAGVCNPHAGGGMMGLVLYNIPFPNFREYLATPLSCTMIPGTTYTVSFWVTNGTGVISPWTISNIGIHFSNTPLIQSGYGLINAIPQCEVTTNITSTVWTQYTFTINPTASWNYLTLGAFRNDASNNVVLSFPNLGGPPSSYANYFFDDIQVLGPSVGNSTIGIASSSGNYSICPGQSLTLLGSGANSYTWSNGSNSSSIIVSPLVTSNFTLSGAAGCAGISQTVATVFVKDAPVIAVNGTQTLCTRTTITLTASGADTYQWSNGVNGPLNVIQPIASTQYTVTGTNIATGCTASTVYQVNVSSTPTVVVSGPTIVCAGTSVNYFATGAQTYTWTNGINGSVYTIAPNSSSSYTVTGFNPFGCTASTTFSVSVDECLSLNNESIEEALFIRPNPVDDVLNLSALNILNSETIQIRIYNSNGLTVNYFEIAPHTSDFLIDMNEISSGFYFIKVSLTNKVYFGKFIKN